MPPGRLVVCCFFQFAHCRVFFWHPLGACMPPSLDLHICARTSTSKYKLQFYNCIHFSYTLHSARQVRPQRVPFHNLWEEATTQRRSIDHSISGSGRPEDQNSGRRIKTGVTYAYAYASIVNLLTLEPGGNARLRTFLELVFHVFLT